TDNYHNVYSATPGILKPNYKVQETMKHFVVEAFSDADLFLVITDVFEDIELDETYIKKLSKSDSPVLVLINKLDLANQEKLEEKVQKWKALLPNAEIIGISALKQFNLDLVLNRIVDLLPEGQAFYANDTLTDKTERFFVSEIIREKILLNYKKEIPYSVEVLVNSFKEEESIIKIQADIVVERDSQKGIIIGNKGAALKKIGTEARKDCETFFGKKVYLELFVKVDKDWRSNDNRLKNYGYR
ncbi:MAG: GTPase Era, partial [Bacteroidia bacterium]